ncbi:hypothetical protein LLG96_04970 [bacterium]|nr:hypothetical protein [bacterium]
MNRIYGPTSGKYISALCFWLGASKKLMIGVKETTSPYNVRIYYQTLANPLSLTNTTSDSFSSSTNLLSMAGNANFIYLVKHNDDTGDSKILHYTDDYTIVAYDKLFNSKWWLYF